MTEIVTDGLSVTGPLLAAELVRVRAGERASLHMPGHKGGRGASALAVETLGAAAFAADVSEMGGYDYLHAPQGALAEAQAAAATTFGAARTFFLVNGSTVGNQAAVMACCGDGDGLVMERGSHRSVYAGCVLSGAVPRYVPMAHDQARDGWFVGDASALGDPLWLTAGPQANSRPQRLGAVHVTRPNYYGMACDLAPWVAFARAHDVPLIVDEAHGAHFGLHPAFPAGALALGADLVIQSTHKTLGALTQSSMLHVGVDAVASGAVDIERLANTLHLLQSSSPSALLTISLDLARAALDQQPFEDVIRLAIDLGERVRGLAPGLALVATDDPTKIVIDVTGLGLTGFGAGERLRTEHGLWVELADFRRIVVSVTLGDSAESVDMIARGLAALCADASIDFGGHAPARAAADANRTVSQAPTDPADALLPVMVVAPRAAEQASKVAVPIEASVGRVVGEYVIPYPPGIPLVVPGERIDTRVLAALARFEAVGCRIVGPSDATLATLRVIAD